MILGTASLLAAPMDRILWLPTTLPDSPLSTDLWPLAAIMPMLLWDLYRQRTIHKAYLIRFGIGIVTGIPLYLLWEAPV